MPAPAEPSNWSYVEIRDLDPAEVDQISQRLGAAKSAAWRQNACAAALLLLSIPAIALVATIGETATTAVCAVLAGAGVWFWLKGNENRRLQVDLKALAAIPRVIRF